MTVAPTPTAGGFKQEDAVAAYGRESPLDPFSDGALARNESFRTAGADIRLSKLFRQNPASVTRGVSQILKQFRKIGTLATAGAEDGNP